MTLLISVAAFLGEGWYAVDLEIAAGVRDAGCDQEVDESVEDAELRVAKLGRLDHLLEGFAVDDVVVNESGLD